MLSLHFVLRTKDFSVEQRLHFHTFHRVPIIIKTAMKLPSAEIENNSGWQQSIPQSCLTKALSSIQNIKLVCRDIYGKIVDHNYSLNIYEVLTYIAVTAVHRKKKKGGGWGVRYPCGSLVIKSALFLKLFVELSFWCILQY